MYVIVAAVIGAGAAVYTSHKAGKAADKAASAAERSADFDAQLAQKQWDRYMEGFAPLEDKLVSEVSKPLEQQTGLKRSLATIDRGYGDVTGDLRRTMGGRYQYGAGQERGSLMNLERQRIGAKAGAVAGAESDLFNRRTQVANIGRGLPGQALSASGKAGQTYGNLLGSYSGAAKGAWDSVKTGVGNLMQLYTMNKTPEIPGADRPYDTPASNPAWDYQQGPSASPAPSPGAYWDGYQWIGG